MPTRGSITLDYAIGSGGGDRFASTRQEVLSKSLTLCDFSQKKFVIQCQALYAEALSWIAQGGLRGREDMVKELSNSPSALIGLLRGFDFGKSLTRVGS